MINHSVRIKLLVLSAVTIFMYSCINRFDSEKKTGKWKEDTSGWPSHFGFGREAPDSVIAKLDIDVSPDGKGLPEGSGSPVDGKPVYIAKCSPCHGVGSEPLQTKLLGGALINDTASGLPYTKFKTIGNYWPYATTLYDYIRRAMPFNAPGSLNNQEVYAVTAYLLYKNKLIDSAFILTKENLASVKMPARPLFVADERKGGTDVQ